MRIQRVMQKGGVREEYVPGVGATPLLRSSRIGYAALVAPTLGTVGIQKISDMDISLSCAGYKPDQFSIHRSSVSHPGLHPGQIHN